MCKVMKNIGSMRTKGVYVKLYPGQAKTSKKPQGIISGVGMLEGNITLPTRNLEGNITLPTRNREGNIRNAINYRPEKSSPNTPKSYDCS